MGASLIVAQCVSGMGCPPRRHNVYAAIGSCVKSLSHSSALRLLATMHSGCVRPTSATYNTLLNIWGRMHDWEKAVLTLESMTLQSVEADVCGPAGRYLGKGLPFAGQCLQTAFEAQRNYLQCGSWFMPALCGMGSCVMSDVRDASNWFECG